jgi:hypothetical protein
MDYTGPPLDRHRVSFSRAQQFYSASGKTRQIVHAVSYDRASPTLIHFNKYMNVNHFILCFFLQ